MEQLRLVGRTAGNDGLVFAAGSTTFVVPFDAAFRAALAQLDASAWGGAPGTAAAEDPPVSEDVSDADDRGTSPLPIDPPADASPTSRPIAVSSSLTPRELQDRLRAGWSIEEVATAAGATPDWVARFAVPVLAEQERIVAAALQLHFDKPRVGLSPTPLAEAVRRNVAERKVALFDEDFDAGWSAFQLGDGLWAIRFRYRSRGRLQEARWRFDPDSDELRSDNRLAHQLGHAAKRRGRPARPTPPPAPSPRRARGTSPSPASAAKKVAAKATSSGARTVAPKATASKKAASRKVASRKVASKATGPKKAAPKTVAPAKVSPKKVAPKKAAPKKVAPKKVAPKKVAPKATSSKKTSPKKVAPKKVAPKATSSKKTSPKKAASAKAATMANSSEKAVAQQASPKRVAPQRVAPAPGARRAPVTDAAPSRPATSSTRAPGRGEVADRAASSASGVGRTGTNGATPEPEALRAIAMAGEGPSGTERIDGRSPAEASPVVNGARPRPTSVPAASGRSNLAPARTGAAPQRREPLRARPVVAAEKTAVPSDGGAAVPTDGPHRTPTFRAGATRAQVAARNGRADVAPAG